MADIEALAASMTPAQRHKLNSALEDVLGREELEAAARELEEMSS
jgi:hypothetical protein